MSTPSKPDLEFEQRLMDRFLEVLIRAGLLVVLVVLCYRIFAPFMQLMVWALILTVTCYPLHQYLARKLGGRQGLASILIVVVSLVVIITPTAVLMSSLGDTVQQFIRNVQNNTLEIPPPRPGIEKLPFVGERIHALWAQADTDLPGLVRNFQPKMGDLAKSALAFVASIGGGLLQFFAAFIIAAIIMAFGESAEKGSRAIFERIAGRKHAAEFIKLSTGTIRAVAQGVIGIAFVQAILVGLALLIAGVPWAGVLAVVVLIIGIAQAPAAIVTLPAVIYIWASGDYSNTAAVGYTVLLVLAGAVDNVLKPLILGLGVDAPMPVILLGALGGMVAAGIIGMFVGATLLALGYQIFMGWVADNPEAVPAETGVKKELAP
jgi:predicted PurR-regulated permease PerM